MQKLHEDRMDRSVKNTTSLKQKREDTSVPPYLIPVCLENGVSTVYNIDQWRMELPKKS